MDSKLFSSSEFYRRRYQNFATLTIVPTALLFILITLFSLFATKEIVVTTTGQVAPASDVISLQSVSDNTITKNNLVNNKVVKKGDALLKYTSPSPSEQMPILDANGQGSRQPANAQIQLTAPSDGVLHLEKDFAGQSNIATGTTVGSIYPDIKKAKKAAITYYTDSSYISSIKKGQRARLTLTNVEHKNVMLTGEVTSIDTTATVTKSANLFKVTAIVNLSDKEHSQIKYGLQGRVTSIIGKKTYFNYYKDKLLASFN